MLLRESRGRGLADEGDDSKVTVGGSCITIGTHNKSTPALEIAAPW